MTLGIDRHRRPPGLLLALALGSLLLAGCGASGGDRSPSLVKVPLPPRSRLMLDVRACNKGANAYCAVELVVVGDGYRSADAMLRTEARVLRASRWRATDADTGLERAATSPGDAMRVTYATARAELEGLELGWIERKRAVAVTLAHTLFQNRPALSVLVEEAAG